MRESELHGAVILFLAHALPPGAIVHHSPNEGKRGWKAQRDLKLFGTRAGWPDIEIIHNGRALFIELKAPKKTTTPEQRTVHSQLRAAGCAVMVAHSLAEVEIFLANEGMPLSARVAA